MSKPITVKVTEQYTKTVLAVVTLEPREFENNWDVYLDGEQIGRLDRSRYSQTYSYGGGSRLGWTGAERTWWSTSISSGLSSRQDALRPLVQAHLAKKARKVAEVQAQQEHTWVRVVGLPGYSVDDIDTTGLMQAAYWMSEQRVPVCVFRVIDPSVVDTFVAAVGGQNFYENAPANAHLAQVAVTTDAATAVEGASPHSSFSREVSDLVTQVAAGM